MTPTVDHGQVVELWLAVGPQYYGGFARRDSGPRLTGAQPGARFRAGATSAIADSRCAGQRLAGMMKVKTWPRSSLSGRMSTSTVVTAGL